MKSSFTLRSLLCLAAISCASFAAADQVVNGGFESGSFSPGWTDTDMSGFSGVGTAGSPPAHSGNNYAYLGASPNNGVLSQSVSTTANTSYTLSFFLQPFNANGAFGPPSNYFNVTFNGVSLLTLTNTPQTANYVNYTFSNLIATGSSSLLTFTYRNDTDYFDLDDVSLNTSGVPDAGSTLWLAFPALGVLCALHLVVTRRSARFARI